MSQFRADMDDDLWTRYKIAKAKMGAQNNTEFLAQLIETWEREHQSGSDLE